MDDFDRAELGACLMVLLGCVREPTEEQVRAYMDGRLAMTPFDSGYVRVIDAQRARADLIAAHAVLGATDDPKEPT